MSVYQHSLHEGMQFNQKDLIPCGVDTSVGVSFGEGLWCNHNEGGWTAKLVIPEFFKFDFQLQSSIGLWLKVYKHHNIDGKVDSFMTCSGKALLHQFICCV